VDVLKPGIKITKTADPTVIHSGDLVTYTFLVENTGDCKLYNIMVTDDVLGAIGGPFDLDKGETKTLTKTGQPHIRRHQLGHRHRRRRAQEGVQRQGRRIRGRPEAGHQDHQDRGPDGDPLRRPGDLHVPGGEHR